jgi:FMN phosphatase YigB (HAD superfamily)
MQIQNNSDIFIFFDDGGVLNDNEIRGKQWQKYCGEFFSSRFGGDPKIWGEINYQVISRYIDIFWKDWKEVYHDYLNFYANYKINWVNAMFELAGRNVPSNLDIEQLFDDVVGYVIPKVRSAIPGIIKSIKILYKRGYSLYTASGEVSKELKMYLDGMGIKHLFKEFYGPDLINTWKYGAEFYENILKELNLDSQHAIIIDDNPRFLESAHEVGANVIQACIDGRFEPQYPNYVLKMKNLPKIIEKLLDSHNL